MSATDRAMLRLADDALAIGGRTAAVRAAIGAAREGTGAPPWPE